MFRNLRHYRFDGAWPASEESLSQNLEKAGFEPCGPLTERSSGWVAVGPDSEDSLARRVNGADLIRLRSQSRVLPSSVINEELESRIEAFRQRTGDVPHPREKRRLKSQARDELLPKAMLRSDRIWGYADLKENVLGIDAVQNSVAERFVRRLQASIDGLNIRPLEFAKPVHELLTGLFFGNAPGQFALGHECRMKDPADSGATVRWTNFDLSNQTIRSHVADGMHLTHLGIEYDNVMRCVLDENGAISKLRFVGMKDDGDDHDDPLARLDTEFVLVTGTLRNLLGDLRKLLGGFA